MPDVRRTSPWLTISAPVNELELFWNLKVPAPVLVKFAVPEIEPSNLSSPDEFDTFTVELDDIVTPLLLAVVPVPEPVYSNVPPANVILSASAVAGFPPSILIFEIDKVPFVIVVEPV